MIQEEYRMQLTDVLTGLNRAFPYYPELCAITGGVGPTLLLCQLLYQSQRVADADGWLTKTTKELEAETGLSRDQQQHARRRLRQRGFLHERHGGIPRRVFYRLDLEAINAALANKEDRA
jgi:hypothetical protein